MTITVNCSTLAASCQQRFNCLSQSLKILYNFMDSELHALVAGCCNNIANHIKIGNVQLRNVQIGNVKMGNADIGRMEWPFSATVLLRKFRTASDECARPGNKSKLISSQSVSLPSTALIETCRCVPSVVSEFTGLFMAE